MAAALDTLLPTGPDRPDTLLPTGPASSFSSAISRPPNRAMGSRLRLGGSQGAANGGSHHGPGCHLARPAERHCRWTGQSSLVLLTNTPLSVALVLFGAVYSAMALTAASTASSFLTSWQDTQFSTFVDAVSFSATFKLWANPDIVMLAAIRAEVVMLRGPHPSVTFDHPHWSKAFHQDPDSVGSCLDH